MLVSRDTLAKSLATVADFVRWGATAFASANLHFGHGTDNALDESLALVLHALHLQHDMPESLLNTQLLEHEKETIADLLLKRIEQRIPVPYLTGTARFMGLEFYVDNRVLIPRSPISELIEQGFSPWLDHEPQGILDLCTGSGCIAVACAYVFPTARVDASDLSTDALEVAEINVAKHALEHRVELHQGDMFDAVGERRYDLIVSNPPYVGMEEMMSLPEEYKHEPDAALRSGDLGLDAVELILQQAPQHLNPGGLLVVELGNTAQGLTERFPDLATTWVDFAKGGHGVFVISREDLASNQVSDQ